MNAGDFKHAYWDDSVAKQEFIRFLNSIHKLDLTLWDSLGYWDNNYRPFSYFREGHIISSVCLYSLDMAVEGRVCKVAQISGVGTLPEYRRQGLNRQLTERVIAWASAKHDFFFLFADHDAYAFYERCGFRRAQEHAACMNIDGMIACPGAVQLDMNKSAHRDLAYGIAQKRAPVSRSLGVLNAKLFMFWCLYGLRDCVYHIPELDVIVLCRRNNGILTLFDIVGPAMPTFDDLYPLIADCEDRSVMFGFMPDCLNLTGGAYDLQPIDNGAFLMGDMPLEHTAYRFPFTSIA